MLAAVALLLSACAALPGGPAPTQAIDFTPTEIRRPAIFVRVNLAPNQFGERERRALPQEYEGALLEGLNERAVLPKDVQLATEGTLDASAALRRAREVGADHAILVEVRVARGETVFCRETRRPLRGLATVWSQEVQVLRTSDGAPRLTITRGPALTVTDIDIDCDDPKASERRSTAETVTQAVRKLLARLLGS